MTNPQKLRILCLHGYTQNAKIFRGRTAVIAKDLKDIAEFVYVSAPHKLPDKEDITEAEKLKRDPNDEGPRAWYKTEQDQQVYIGYDESLAYLQRFYSENGPFDALLGFSQGATLSALLTSTLPTLSLPLPRFLLLSGGYLPSPTPTHSVLTPTNKLTIPSLHVIGREDKWVLPERSEALLECFEERGREVHYHEGGHFLPTGAENRRKYREWVAGFLKVDGEGVVEAQK
ncbi:hypothetical protein HK097_003530 [Rhizophlyctis rosea]|uniref:Serine hydrolase domain-containing protein n=1 Tax=Rhizophlyctis rosea TaxID=64517 RepID=A0AAD5S3J8_9FUNG|nr:hypothetical protein HK097_003530 [Rhizophlyctis rosea]